MDRSDRLAELAASLATLDDQPVEAHPDVLERVQRAIVQELDALATSTRAPPRE